MKDVIKNSKKIKDLEYIYYVYNSGIVVAINQNFCADEDKDKIEYVKDSKNMFLRDFKYKIDNFTVCDETSKKILLRRLIDLKLYVDKNLLDIIPEGIYDIKVSDEITPYLFIENKEYKFLFPLIILSDKYLDWHPAAEKCFEKVKEDVL